MASEERDLQFERALAKHLRNESDASCPDAEILAAYHERTLAPDEMTYWKSHIASCARCQEALSLLEATGKALGEGNSSERDRGLLIEEWTRATSFRAASATPRGVASEGEPTQAMAAAGSPSAKVMELQQRQTARRWFVPLGTLAAALLLVAGWYEMRLSNRVKVAPSEMAVNRPAPPQEQQRADYSSAEEASKPAHARPPANSRTAPSPIFPRTPVPSPRPDEPAVLDSAKPPGARSREAARDGELTRQALADARARASLSNSVEDRAAGNQGTVSGRDQSAAPENQVARAPAAYAPQTTAVGGAAAKTKAERNAGTMEKKDLPRAVNATVEVQAAAPVAGSSEAVAVPSEPPGADADGSLSSRELSRPGAAAVQNAVVVPAPGSQHAWRVGAAGAVEWTTNAGKSWKLQKSGTTSDLTAGSAVSDKVCWLGGKAGTLLRTTDGGRHWIKITTPIQGDLGGVHAIDAQHAAIWDLPNRQNFETADGGATWKRAGNE